MTIQYVNAHAIAEKSILDDDLQHMYIKSASLVI